MKKFSLQNMEAPRCAEAGCGRADAGAARGGGPAPRGVRAAATGGEGTFPRRPLPGPVAGPQQAGESSRVFNYTPSLCSLHFSAPFAVRHTWN